MNPSDEREPAIYGQATVIVIDDDPEIRDQLAALFAEAGMAVRCFAAAEDFLAAYSPVQCACAVVDMALAGMDGMQLLAALAEREILLPVIFLTGYGDVPSSVRALKAGAVMAPATVVDDAVRLLTIHGAKGLEAGRCDVLTTDQSGLYAQRIKMAHPDEFLVLPEVISKEPLGPLVRKGDDEWFSIVKWTLFAMLNAEEMGINSQNVEEQAKSTKNPDVARLLGADGDYGKDLKLRKDWVVQIVKQVGNYDEVFERNVGQGSVLKIKRGLNALWSNGGIQYAPPVR